MNSDNYIHTEGCSNCGWSNTLVIPKGKALDSFLKNTDCSNCGVVLKQPDYRVGGDRPIL